MKFTKISRELLKAIKFRVFDENDYFGFAGVESPVPLIGEIESEGILVIIDGNYAELYAFDGCANFDLIDTCENIRELPVKTQREIEIEKRIQNLKSELAALENELCY